MRAASHSMHRHVRASIHANVVHVARKRARPRGDVHTCTRYSSCHSASGISASGCRAGARVRSRLFGGIALMARYDDDDGEWCLLPEQIAFE